MKDIERLGNLFEKEFHNTPLIDPINGGGSSRRYYRLKDRSISVIGVVGEDIHENEVFVRLDKCLQEASINVPEVIKVSTDKKAYLLQDLGDTSLFSLLNNSNRLIHSEKALRKLICIQCIPETKWANVVGYKPFDERLIRWDLNYFKYDYLKPSNIAFNEEKLEDDFDTLVSKLSHTNIVNGLMYRDFQSRNIMVKDDELWFIDFQSARKGPLVYDAVSFIWQAKAPFTFEEREYLNQFYSAALALKLGLQKSQILTQLNSMIILRTLQVLGAYGFRGLIERKKHFIDSIPYAITNFKYLRDKGYLVDYPEIEKIADSLKIEETKEKSDFLTLSVYSFSYKKGYPEDKSGNGGGFIFDCRGITNPGRYEEYKCLTGLDQPVIEFMERNNEAADFLYKAESLVTPTIDRYLRRGFTSLQIGFGCTGGRHRSVYCAEHFAEDIKRLYPEVRVQLNHREQEIERNL